MPVHFSRNQIQIIRLAENYHTAHPIVPCEVSQAGLRCTTRSNPSVLKVFGRYKRFGGDSIAEPLYVIFLFS